MGKRVLTFQSLKEEGGFHAEVKEMQLVIVCSNNRRGSSMNQ